MNGNYVVDVPISNALAVTSYTFDEIPPTLEAFHLDLDSNQLVLSFDETVYASSLQFSSITLHSSTTIPESNLTVTLRGGTVVSENNHIVYASTLTSDINLVKLYPDFGTEVSNTYLTIRDSAIMDLSQRPNYLLSTTLQASMVVPDETQPRLQMFTVDLNAGQLHLYFNEPVNASTFLAHGLTVQSARRSRTGVRLTNSFTNSSNGLAIIVQLSDEDLNEIKRIDALLVSQETSYVTITTDLIQDMSGNPVVPIGNGQALSAAAYTEDMRKPYVTSYELDMNAGYVVISFSETVNVSTFLCTELTFASSVDCNVSYTLTGCVIDTCNVSRESEDVGTSGSGSGDYGSAPKWITPYHYDTSVSFWITLDDLNQLKGLEIAATAFTTFLSYTANTILDQNNLTLCERNCTMMGLPISSDQYTPDTTPPEIVSFNLSVNTGKLVISFTETVRSSTLQVHRLTLQSTASIENGTQTYTLGMDRSTRTFDGPTDILTVYIAPGDLNRIKFLTGLATSNDTTHLSATSDTIMDMKGIELVPVSSFEALPVTTFEPDNTSPALVSYVLDLDLGLVYLTFDETVNIETLNFTKLAFQALPDLSVFSAPNVTADSNFTNTTNTTFSGSGTMLDVLDLSVYNTCGILLFQLTNGYVLSTENDPEVTFNITWDDLNAIKREPCLATSQENSYLSFAESAILDMNDNGIAAVDQNSGIMVSQFIADDTNPNLIAFDLNLTSEILTLSFDETVNASSFDPTQITFIAAPIVLVSINISSDNTTDTNMTQFEIVEYLTSEPNYTLVGGDLLYGDDPILYLKLSKDDLNMIKAIVELATDAGNTYISITATMVSDMNRNMINEITPINATQVDMFTDDRVLPTLVAFDLDLDAERLILTFDETVNVSSLNLSALTLVSNNSAIPSEQWSLNGGSPPIYSYSPSNNQPVVTIDIGYLDINEIKRLSQLAVSNDTTYLAIEYGAILDMNTNPVVAIAIESAIQVQEYSFDITPPQLVNFDLDLNLGTLVMEFTETVNASSVITSDLLLQNETSLLSYLSIFNSSVRQYDDVFIFVDFGIEYLNELKQTDDLATDSINTYLSFPASALTDMNGNAVVAVGNTTARLVQNYTRDTTSPQLLSFDLDMDVGVLTLYLDETVRVSTINTTFITLAQSPFTVRSTSASGFGSSLAMSGSGSGSGSGDLSIEFYTLTGGFVQTENLHIVAINLTLFDLNEIKKLRSLATMEANTHLLLIAETLDDMYNNPIVPIEEGNGLIVSTFTEDTTPPDIVSYHLNMNTGILTISFTETVDMRTLVIPDRIIFYNSSDFEGESYALINSRSDSGDGPEVVIDLSPLDLNQLKFIRNLASNQQNTFLFLNETISDMAGNIITPLFMGLNQTRPANQFTNDTTAPVLLQFNLDVDSGQIFLSFSEVVDQIFEPAFAIQSDRNETNMTSSHTLTGSETIYGPTLSPLGPGFPPEVTILLSDADLNEIKRLDRLAVSNESTYLSITYQAAADAFDNTITPITEDDALQVTVWTADTTNPLLVSFDFSADTGLLELTFDETVRVSSFNVTTITFVNPLTTTEYTLQDQPPFGGAELSAIDSTVVELVLSNDDLNELKVLTDLATSPNNTYLQLQTLSISDMNVNPLNTSNLPLQVSSYSADTTRPDLVSFNLDMDTATLVLSFSESVNVSSLDITQITLQPSSYENTTNNSYTLLPSFDYPEGTITNSTNGPIIVLHFGTVDTNEIKRIFALATSQSNTHIAITSDTVRDMVDLNVNPIENINATRVQNYIVDSTNPTLLAFDLDLDAEILTLTFDETVNISSIRNAYITLQDSIPSVTYTLTMGTAVGFNDPVVYFPLTFFDLNQIKLRRTLATDATDTYINLALGAILDMALPPNPSDGVVMQVQNFTDDTTRPNLTNFVIDINSSLLILNFNEPVDRMTLDIQQITFQSSSVRFPDPDLYYTLQGGDSNSTDGLTIHIMIDNNDLNEIKRRPALFVNQDTSYISVTEFLISDMHTNRLVPIPHTNAQRAFEVLTDTTRPHVLEFHLDMDASRLHLTFLETVNASSINFTSFVIQADSYVVDSQMQYRLTGGDLESYNDSTAVTIVITLEDLNEIKARQIATSTPTSWLVVEATGINDMNDLPILPLINGVNASRASRYTIDTTRPELTRFDFDLDTRILTMYFSETVRANSLNSTTITLQNAQLASGITNVYTITELGMVLDPDGPIVRVQLTTFDMNELKRRPGLATDIATTFISVRSSTVFDMQMNFLVPIPNGGALQASSVPPDVTEPVLLEFSLDMDSANLTLTFNEAVNASSLTPSGITLWSPFFSQYTLTGGFVIDCYGTVVTMNLNDRDFDLVKVRDSLCTGMIPNDCRLTFESNSILDMSQNGNNNITIAPTSVIPDTTSPELVYYDLDLTAEELRLTFSEVVRTFGDSTVQGITLLATPFEFHALSNTSKGINLDESRPETYDGTLRAYTLSGGVLSGPVVNQDHPPVLVVTLSLKDLNILKSLESVATGAQDTFLLIESTSAEDFSSNPLTAVQNSNGKQVRVYTPDQIKPQLFGFDFDLNSGELTLTFSETVNRSSLHTPGISLQGSGNFSLSDLFTLTGGVSTNYNNPVITVTLSAQDLNEVKRLTQIATENSTTYISITDSTISDQDDNPVFPILDGNADRVKMFTPDTTRPNVIGFSLDLNTGQIHLTFDETVNSSSFVIDTLTLTDNVTTVDTNHSLSTGMLLTGDSTVLSYMLNDADLNEIKRVNICTVAARGQDCYLTFTNETISDMSMNPVIPREDGDAILVDPYIAAIQNQQTHT